MGIRSSSHWTLQERLDEYEKIEKEKAERIEKEQGERQAREKQLKESRNSKRSGGVLPQQKCGKKLKIQETSSPEPVSERTCELCKKVLKTTSGKAMHKRDVHMVPPRWLAEDLK